MFIATSLGGSYQALRSISGWMAGFVQVPRERLELSTNVITLNPGRSGPSPSAGASTHSTQGEPDTIEEIRRILGVHAETVMAAGLACSEVAGAHQQWGRRHRVLAVRT